MCNVKNDSKKYKKINKNLRAWIFKMLKWDWRKISGRVWVRAVWSHGSVFRPVFAIRPVFAEVLPLRNRKLQNTYYFYKLSKIVTVIRLKSEVSQLVQINYKWLFGLSIEIAELDCTFKNQFNESWTLQNAYKIVFE